MPICGSHSGVAEG